MNCGNSEKYSRSALGFSPLIPAHLSSTRTGEASVLPPSAVGTSGCRRTPQPSHSRYPAPATVRAVSAAGELATMTARPATATSAWTACPVISPVTAGTTVRPRSPAEIA